MRFNLVDELPHSRALVFSTHRDKLLELVQYLPNIKGVETTSRVVDGSVVRLENVWKGSSEDVPSVIRPLVKAEYLSWIDRAKWDESDWSCEWQIELSLLKDAVTARGRNTFTEEDGVTIINMSGEFLIHPEKIPGVPTFVARSAAPTLEKFVIGLLQPNLRKSNEAVVSYIDDNY